MIPWGKKTNIETLIAQCPFPCKMRHITTDRNFTSGEVTWEKSAGGGTLRHPALGKKGLFIPFQQLKLPLVDLLLEVETEEPPVMGWQAKELKKWGRDTKYTKKRNR